MYFHVDPNSKAGKVILVVGLPMFAAFLYFLARESSRALGSCSWPSVVGAITESRIERITTGHGTHDDARVRFRYTVNDASYENDKIAFGLARGMLTWGHGQRLVARFPTDATVPVFYNPNNPSVSCLQPGGFGWEDGFLFFVSVTGIVCGLKTAWRGIRFVSKWIVEPPKRPAASS